jgi:hypothetical protein
MQLSSDDGGDVTATTALERSKILKGEHGGPAPGTEDHTVIAAIGLSLKQASTMLVVVAFGPLYTLYLLTKFFILGLKLRCCARKLDILRFENSILIQESNVLRLTLLKESIAQRDLLSQNGVQGYPLKDFR